MDTDVTGAAATAAARSGGTARARQPLDGDLSHRLSELIEWPFFADHHRKLARDLHRWCETELRGADHGDDVDEECRQLVAKLAAGGWLAYTVPAQYGGVHADLDVRSLCLIRQTLASYSGLAGFSFAMQGLGSGTISLFGSPEQKAAYLPALARGEKITAFAMTELKSGSDVANMDMPVTRECTYFVLQGEKTYISNGGIADFYLVLARSGEQSGARGISALIVDADREGLCIAERIEVMAPHPLARLAFDDCRVDDAALVGTAGAGFSQAMATLDIFRPTVGAAALGFAERALAEATARANSRYLFGSSLATNAITQSKLAEIVVDADAASLLVYRAAWVHDMMKRPNTREAAVAKLFATEAAQTVVDKAVQLFGGLGVVKGVPVETLYREVRALRIYEGASEVQKMIIARRHLAGAAHLPAQ